MTEREWLQQLFEDVRGYFRFEAEPEEQKKREKDMRETMYGYMEAREKDDFDDAQRQSLGAGRLRTVPLERRVIRLGAATK